jgi:hypothetical protein
MLAGALGAEQAHPSRVPPATPGPLPKVAARVIDAERCRVIKAHSSSNLGPGRAPAASDKRIDIGHGDKRPLAEIDDRQIAAADHAIGEVC